MEEASTRQSATVLQLIEREALALVEAIKKFQSYLHDRKVVVYTYQSSLRWLMNAKDATS